MDPALSHLAQPPKPRFGDGQPVPVKMVAPLKVRELEYRIQNGVLFIRMARGRNQFSAQINVQHTKELLIFLQQATSGSLRFADLEFRFTATGLDLITRHFEKETVLDNGDSTLRQTLIDLIEAGSP